MLVIGVSGTKRSGKNTFADYIKEHLEEQGKSVKIGSWAELLKKSAYESLGFAKTLEVSIYELWADAFKQGHKIQIVNSLGETIHSISGREFLQRYGTEGHREVFGDNFWINQFWEANEFNGVDVLIITDCRYDNEAENVLGRDGVIVKIDNPNTDSEEDTHASEQGINEKFIEYRISNNSSLEDFKEKSIKVIEEIYA
jgi:thymidylate kinase